MASLHGIQISSGTGGSALTPEQKRFNNLIRQIDQTQNTIQNLCLILASFLYGTSVGKRIFGLSLNGSASATFLRAFYFLPSVGFCGVGLIWALFNKKRRCWHDAAADLQPMELARL